MKRHVRHGFGSLRPYIHGPRTLPQFSQEAFGAVELERHELGPESFHVELQLEDSIIVVEAGDLPPSVSPWTGSIYVYVDDVDAAYHRALEAGAESVARPQDKPYHERQAGVRHAGENTWWIATYKAHAES